MPYRALILIVCSGNICRSPMAEYLLRHYITQVGDGERLRVASAGTWCLPDQPASSHGQALLLEQGIDMSAHRSRVLTQQLLDEADLVLVMTRAQRQDILTRFTRVERKLYLLSEMIGKTYDIADPYEGSLLEYQYCKREVESILTQGYQKIVRLALRQDDQEDKPRRFRWWR